MKKKIKFYLKILKLSIFRQTEEDAIEFHKMLREAFKIKDFDKYPQNGQENLISHESSRKTESEDKMILELVTEDDDVCIIDIRENMTVLRADFKDLPYDVLDALLAYLNFAGMIEYVKKEN